MTWLLRTAAGVLRAGWLGSWGLFALVIAPTAFRVLPSHAIAGDLVGPVLSILHRFGIGAGLGLGLLAVLARGSRVAGVLPLILAAICAGSEFIVTPAIAELGREAFGEEMVRASANRFSNLHQLSRLLFGLVGLGVLALIGLSARPDRRPASGRAHSFTVRGGQSKARKRAP